MSCDVTRKVSEEEADKSFLEGNKASTCKEEYDQCSGVNNKRYLQSQNTCVVRNERTDAVQILEKI